MAINLTKGQKIDLTKKTGEKLEKFCVEVSWGAIEKSSLFGLMKSHEDVDLDLSCIIVNDKGEWIDHVYSPEYNGFLQKNKIPLGKLTTNDRALVHSGDDLGQGGGADFKEVITVDLSKLSSNADRIFFFLNIYLNKGQSFDFSDIPFAKINMYEGTPKRVEKDFSSFDIVTDAAYSQKKAIIMGKLYKRNELWKFDAIGDATDDAIFINTISRIIKSYV
jgi:tellurium resistance protein TerZ